MTEAMPQLYKCTKCGEMTTCWFSIMQYGDSMGRVIDKSSAWPMCESCGVKCMGRVGDYMAKCMESLRKSGRGATLPPIPKGPETVEPEKPYPEHLIRECKPSRSKSSQAIPTLPLLAKA